MYNWNSHQLLIPNTILYGPGCLDELGKKAKDLGKNALVVTDNIMVSAGYVEKLRNTLMDQDLNCVIFDQANYEPTTTLISDGVKTYKDKKCDFLIALGGGSPIDAAKAIGAMTVNTGKLADYMGSNKITVTPPPLVAVATTSGTGSEVTKVTIITDVENDVKMLISSDNLMPKISVNDPLLTMSVPQNVTAATGIDAFCHAAEAYISIKSQPFTDEMALSAISRISKYIRRAWANGNDLEARSQMMLASMEAGIAFSNSSVTIIHGMSRPIGANFNIAHGISNAVLLVTCMEFAMMGAPEKFAKIASAMGENIENLTTMQAAKASITAMRELCADLNIPTISGLGVDKEKFLSLLPKMADDALESGSPANTPRKVTKEEIISLYQQAF